jgi:hypothetical protein
MTIILLFKSKIVEVLGSNFDFCILYAMSLLNEICLRGQICFFFTQSSNLICIKLI